MSSFSIWVLVAGENDAVICASDAGSSRLLRVMKRGVQSGNDEIDRRDFAWQLMSELQRGAESQAYDGAIIMATQDILLELRRVAVPDVKKRLMAEIARPSSEGYAIPVGFENYVADMPALGGMQ
ncbi:MAG TPA: host attachment protein [Rhizomicrobium sp.]|nr:host attachment protein [Rhizomicrobium sp.]